ncbi:MAG: UDP-N-acetylglucosamine--N-acetylmuramyl-(pentapeptide) pyrophosphoryl-undecaprenol N-acetylglucosamine transferase [Alphaproteobacteria bacterium]|nr:UDP-N-acetylglucosamine--N-acetylmuramyl-(pentapeptide) pyrophosphoryl-undecaprenol N-acetylglucosamine transferase [Alphaproteobacteria bacterium]
MLKIAICSGGTGGHMFPACALFEALKSRGHNVNMITDTRGNRFCSNISESNKIVINTIRFTLRTLLIDIPTFISEACSLYKLWKDNRPDIIIGFGGLFTVIPIFVGKFLRSKIIIYEQNSVIGRANALLASFADCKISTFSIGEDWHQLSSPVRKEFIEAAKSDYKCDNRLKIVVIGGSQGALSFSCIIPNSLSLIDANLRSNIDIVQQVSSAKLDELKMKYEELGINAHLLDFVHDVAREMAEAQLIICRSGASTLAELSTLGRPAILIPYPFASDNHQFHNAVCYKNKRAAWLVEEDENIEKKLAEIIINLLMHRELLKAAASNMINKLGNKSTEIFADFIEKNIDK